VIVVIVDVKSARSRCDTERKTKRGRRRTRGCGGERAALTMDACRGARAGREVENAMVIRVGDVEIGADPPCTAVALGV
jgi:hypothetical protein